MRKIGFDAARGVLVIMGGEVYPARSLYAVPDGDGMIRIWSVAERVELYAHWRDIADLDGEEFETQDDALAYLGAVFGQPGGERIQDEASTALGGYRVIGMTGAGIGYASSDDAGSVAAVLGITTAASEPGATPSYSRGGVLTEASWTWEIGPVFLGLEGRLTQPAPERGVVLQVGIAPGPARLLIDIQEPYYLAS